VDLSRLKNLLYDLIEEIDDLEYNTPERVAQREAHAKWIAEHPEEYGVFSPKLFSKKIQEQFYNSGVIDNVE